MKNSITKKSSVPQIQSSLFFVNLRREMDKMADTCKKGELVCKAHEYLKDGMTLAETKELLKVDGYDPILVESYVKNILSEEVKEDKEPLWGFDVEDSQGRIYASSELNIKIHAKTKEEAWEKVEEEISKSDNISQIIDVYRI